MPEKLGIHRNLIFRNIFRDTLVFLIRMCQDRSMRDISSKVCWKAEALSEVLRQRTCSMMQAGGDAVFWFGAIAGRGCR
jgi:hypothetical protein